mmetsp:Transcript_23885/g.47535  ORF Transcript_23885/g.47535 Transcript_23885/m.47535 type:complete len:204 (-) Transcript_23885:1129-1740(-)
MASTGLIMEMSQPDVSWSFRYSLTFSMIWASWALFLSSQKMVRAPEARARETARRTQSRMGSSFVWHMRQMSPESTSWPKYSSPVDLSTTRILPDEGTSNVLSWLPYSSAFWAMRPTFATLPMVATSNWPWVLQNDSTSWYMVAYDLSGMRHLVSSSSSSLFHIWPESRTTTGMEASMMTSEGTWRLVMPLWEFTMASQGRSA